MAGKCTLEGVLSGLVGTEELQKLNALLDMSEALQGYESEISLKAKK